MPPYRDRSTAGLVLAAQLDAYAGRPGVVVLALPRGGVPVAAPVAQRLDAPLDVLVVRKLGVPGAEEFAFGAIAADAEVIDHDAVRLMRLDPARIAEVRRRQRRELDRRERVYRDGRPAPDLRGKVAILVDDGLATGATMQCAVLAARTRGAAAVVVAVPVGAAEACARLRAIADAVVCPLVPADFTAVGGWYRDFTQVDDDAVRAVLTAAAARTPHPA